MLRASAIFLVLGGLIFGSVQAQGTPPDNSWNLTGMDAQTVSDDCCGASAQTDTPEDLPCQSFNNDLYETLDAGTQGMCDADIKTYSLGFDADFFYFENELRGSWDQCSDAIGPTNGGESRQYQMEVDADLSNTANFDWIFIYTPKKIHCRADADTSQPCEQRWIDVGEGGSGDIAAFADGNDDYGSPNVTDPDPPGSNDGFESDFKPTDAVFARIITRGGGGGGGGGGKNIPQMALRRSALGSPNVIASRIWATQNSSFDKGDFPHHDKFLGTMTEFENKDFDNSHGVGSTNWPQGGPNATPITLAYFQAKRVAKDVELEWMTATEADQIGFLLYGRKGKDWIRITEKLIPSRSVDSASPQYYRMVLPASDFEAFQLRDIDTRGREHRHGPFLLGEQFGEMIFASPIDWQAIQADRDSRRKERVLKADPGARFAAGLDASNSKVELRVRDEGIYQVRHEDLLAAGLDFSEIGLNELALFNRGRSVPLKVVSGSPESTHFSGGSYLEFWGQPESSLYTKTNVYYLTREAAQAKRIPSLEAPPRGWLRRTESYYWETSVREQERLYSFASPNGDPWFESSLLALGEVASQSFNLHLDEIARTAPRGASLKVDLWGVTNFPGQEPDHHVLLYLNQEQIAELWFDGLSTQSIEALVPLDLLREGSNEVVVELPGDTLHPADLVNLDRFQITYPRVTRARHDRLAFSAASGSFQVGGLDSPEVRVYWRNEDAIREVTGVQVRSNETDYTASFQGPRQPGRYFIATANSLLKPEIRNPRADADITGGVAEYLIISHSDFLSGLGPLVAARERDGLQVRTVDVADIYSQFGFGIVSAEAIQDYVRFAAENMGTRFVLLVGGDTYDYNDYLDIGSISFIPSLYQKTHRVVSFTPADPLFTDLDGDLVPDLPIGRFPVRTRLELDILIQKTLQYRTSAPSSALLVADRNEPAMSFSSESDRLAQQIPTEWTVKFAYLDQLGLETTQAEILRSMNEGLGLISFFGHSGPTRWSRESLFSSADAEFLQNQLQPFLVTQWGCWNTYHVAPMYDTLAHKFLLNEEGGAAAVLGAATLTESVSERQLAALLFERIFRNGTTVGEAVQEAKQVLAQSSPELLDVLVGWTLLGDPAMRLRIPLPNVNLLRQRGEKP